MTTADKLQIGDVFVGYVECQDLYGSKFERRGDAGQKRIIDGEKIAVLVVVQGDACTASELANVFAALPPEHPLQICDGFWVYGRKDTRSSRVIINGWLDRLTQRSCA